MFFSIIFCELIRKCGVSLLLTATHTLLAIINFSPYIFESHIDKCNIKYYSYVVKTQLQLKQKIIKVIL